MRTFAGVNSPRAWSSWSTLHPQPPVVRWPTRNEKHMPKKAPKESKIAALADTLLPTDAGPIDSVDPKPYSDDRRMTRARERSQRRFERHLDAGPVGMLSSPSPRSTGRYRGGRRHRRGDVRSALLLLIAEQPRHGYELMQAIGERSNGAWQPSPGSVYPALQQLQDEGLVRVEEDESKRGIAHLTPAGEQYVEEFNAELSHVWESSKGNDIKSLRDAMHGIGLAARQVGQVGTAEHVAAAVAALNATQRELYAILATEPTNEAPADTPTTAPISSTSASKRPARKAKPARKGN